MSINEKIIKSIEIMLDKKLSESQYFGIGYKKLKMFVEEHSDEKFVLWNGNRAQIKRQMFEKYINEEMSAI